MQNSTMQKSFQPLISLLVTEKDTGHKALALCVARGEVREEEAVVIEVHAYLEKIQRGLDRVLLKL